MKVFDVAGRIAGSGEHVLGFDETGSHACYLIYGVLRAGEQGRVLNPGHGHEEMVLVVKGELTLTGQRAGTVRQGQAIHLVGETSCIAENRTNTEAVYVIAGGHAEVEHPH
jgi:redox-sensitive bicupin YhaK (pirin superfamily)